LAIAISNSLKDENRFSADPFHLPFILSENKINSQYEDILMSNDQKRNI
jgi:hypothetical protein